jgi:hypothetical protein
MPPVSEKTVRFICFLYFVHIDHPHRQVVLSDYGRRRLCISVYFRMRAPMAASVDGNSYSRRALTSYTTIISVRGDPKWLGKAMQVRACAS